MARQSNSKTGNSRIRFIMLEADLSDGDLSQVTEAIQNALRPTHANLRSTPLPLAQRATGLENSAEQTVELDDESFEVAPEMPRPKSQRNNRPKVARTPVVLDDLDITTPPSLKDFVSQYEVSSNFDKYLVIALWFRDARATPSVTTDHVYTCFKLLGWSTATNDFLKPLQNLKGEQSFKGGAKEGFTLTLTGAGKIEAKKRTS